jgi:hypothetical protein
LRWFAPALAALAVVGAHSVIGPSTAQQAVCVGDRSGKKQYRPRSAPLWLGVPVPIELLPLGWRPCSVIWQLLNPSKPCQKGETMPIVRERLSRLTVI